MWGNQATADYEPTWNTYANHTIAQAPVEKSNMILTTDKCKIDQRIDNQKAI